MTTIQVYPEKEYPITSSACLRLGDSARCLVILLTVSVTAFLLQPRIGVRDEDSYSYIIGAYSIQAGNGYNDLNGEPLNHYPPVYSLILSLFASPLLAALFLNYIAFGAAVALIYRLAREHGKWAEPAALGLALAVGFIFLRRLATNASPDVLTYALFFLALYLYYQSSSRLRMISYLIWGLVIPIKLIAVIFIPAAVILRYPGKPMRVIRAEGRELLVASGSWLLFLSIILAYNFLTIQTLLPQSHLGARPDHSPYDLIGAASQFLVSIPRNFLSNWYGSLGVASALFPFSIVLLVALLCLITLRLHLSRMAWHAILLILLSVLLQFGSRQVAGARLVGYGFITLLLALYPVGKWYKMWVVYGLLGLALSTFNAFTQNALGANDPRYEKLARESLQIKAFPKGILTNSFHILDLHAKIPTRYTYSAEHLEGEEYFLLVSLPKYDAIASTVSPVEKMGKGWCEVASMTGAKLFRKCLLTGDAHEK